LRGGEILNTSKVFLGKVKKWKKELTVGSKRGESGKREKGIIREGFRKRSSKSFALEEIEEGKKHAPKGAVNEKAKTRKKRSLRKTPAGETFRWK